MKTKIILAIVMTVHCVALGSLVVMQGCRSSRVMADRQDGTLPEPVQAEPAAPVATKPVTVKPVVSDWDVKPIAVKTTTYVVQKGDSLSVIAKRYKVKESEILQLNPKIKDKNSIRLGQKLLLPGTIDIKAVPVLEVKTQTAEVKPVSFSSTPEPAPVVAAVGVYVVQPGDKLALIAKRNGTTVAAIKKANNLSSDLIKVGQKLKIPGAADVETAPVTKVSLDSEPATAVSTVDGIIEESAELEAPIVDAGAFKTHTVKPDEDLKTVALYWGVSEDQIRKLNALGPTDDVTPGQVLKVMPAE